MSDGFTVLKENTLFTNFQPHFHLRGKAMEVEAILPDGRRQTIAYVGHFNFNWMTTSQDATRRRAGAARRPVTSR